MTSSTQSPPRRTGRAALGLAGRGRRCAPGLTLLEITLALGLVVMLLGVGIASFRGALDEVKISDSITRLSALLRSARAEAANTGRCYRLSFDVETGQPAMAVESDPLGAPGEFFVYSAWWVDRAELPAGVRLIRCELTGDAAWMAMAAAARRDGDDESSFADVTFYPDGSSDSATILLAEDADEPAWGVEIKLNGVDGTIHTRDIDTEEEPIEVTP